LSAIVESTAVAMASWQSKKCKKNKRA